MAKLDVKNCLVRPKEPSLFDSTPVLRERVFDVEKELNRVFVGMNAEIRMMILAVLSGEHMLFLSKTGAAKSTLVGNLFKHFGGEKFSHQCGVKDNENRYFGPINAAKYAESGQYLRPERNFMQHADWAFLDEVFDAPDNILRMLLSVLNEREYEEADGEKRKTPLKSAFGAANYLRTNEVTEAFTDRFLLVAPMANDLAPQQELEVHLNVEEGRFLESGGTQLSLEDLECLVRARDEVKIPADVLYLQTLLVNSFLGRIAAVMPGMAEKARISMRRRVQYHKVLKAAALLGGRSVVEDQDLGVLESCLGVGVLAAQRGPGAAKFSDVFRGTQVQFSDPKREAQLRVIGAAIDGVGLKLEEAQRVRELVGIGEKLPRVFGDEVEVARWMADRLTPDSSAIQDFQDVYRRRRVNAA